MLVLTRRSEESIILKTAEGEVEIKFLGFQHGRARVGINAPKSINVVRSELIKRGDNFGNR